MVKVIWGRVVAVANYVEEGVVDLREFHDLLHGAADAGAFDVWPFRGGNIISAMYYIPDIIYAASVVQKFDAVFHYLKLLFNRAGASCLQPNKYPCLHEALSLLAQAYTCQRPLHLRGSALQSSWAMGASPGC